MSSARAAAAGAGAAFAWAAVEPLDKRLFRLDYSDVALLGKLVTRSRWWPAAGLALHMTNGAVFGLAYNRLRPRSALALALAENFATFPFASQVVRRHPASGEAGLAAVGNVRGLAQATARHALFGVVLGRLVG